MKPIKNLILISCIGWVLVSVVGCRKTDAGIHPTLTPTDGLTLQIKLEQEDYLIGEEVRGEYVLANQSGIPEWVIKYPQLDPFGIDTMGMAGLIFKIIKPSGIEAQLSSRISIHLPDPEDFIPLQPDELFKREYSLGEWGLDETGLYIIQISYFNPIDLGTGVNAWKGIVHSNTVQFSIK